MSANITDTRIEFVSNGQYAFGVYEDGTVKFVHISHPDGFTIRELIEIDHNENTRFAKAALALCDTAVSRGIMPQKYHAQNQMWS